MELSCKLVKCFPGEFQNRTRSYLVACKRQKFLGGFGLMMLDIKMETLFYHVPNNLSLHYPQNISGKGVTRLGGWEWRGKVLSWEAGRERAT